MPSEEESRRRLEEFDTTTILAAVDALDDIRAILADGPFGSEPPQARANLLELHELAHEIINEGHDLNPRVEKMVMLADDVIADMLSLSDLADKIRDTLEALVRATPEP